MLSYWMIKALSNKRVECLSNFRGHSSKILSVSCCKEYSVAISGDISGEIIIWDLNRKQYVRSVQFESNIITTKINGNTGDFLACSNTTLGLWDINGTTLTRNVVSTNDIITAAAFYEGQEWLVFESLLIVTGHSNGDIRLWSRDIDLTLTTTLSISDPVVCISWPPTFRYLLASSEKEIHAFVMPDGSGTEIHYVRNDDFCNSCNVKFAVLDRKSNCKICGRNVCANCIKEMSCIICIK